MDNGILILPPANTALSYIPRDDAAAIFNLPTHMVNYWIAKRRIRIAEFRRENERRRILYVNKDDLSRLKHLYDISVEMLSEERDDIPYLEVTDKFPGITKGVLDYLISNCLVDCYIPDSLDWNESIVRRSDLEVVTGQLSNIKSDFDKLRAYNQTVLQRDVNGILSKMVYLYCFFTEFKTFNFHPVEAMNFRFVTIKVNGSSRLEYREGYNFLDLLTTGELNGLLDGVLN